MKLLETISYSGDPFAIVAEHILAVMPNHRHGCSVIVQDANPEGTTFVVRDSYDDVKRKLEAL